MADELLAGGSGWLGIPPPCEAGSRVGVIAPSGPVKPRLLSEGLRILREWGLVPVLYRSAELPDGHNLDESAGSVGEDVPFLETEPGDTSNRESRDGVAVAASLASTEASGFLSGSDSVRAAELQAALADRSTRAVLCARGGHGAARLLPLVDWAAAAAGARHKRFFGFSDATVLHSAMHAAARGSRDCADAATAAVGMVSGGSSVDEEQGGGLLTFHAPMIATGRTFVQLPDSDLERFRAALFAPMLDNSLFSPLAGQILYGATPRTQGGGTSRAVGMLIGGNLTTLASLCGGGWFANFGVADHELGMPCPYILALEDENETAVRIDRHCRQLRMAGLLNDRDGSADSCGAAAVFGGGSREGNRVTADEADEAGAGASRRAIMPRMVGLVLGRFDKDDVLLPSGALGPCPGEVRVASPFCCGKRACALPSMFVHLL